MSNSNTDLSCSEAGNSVNCSGTTRTTETSTPPTTFSYQVSGATLSLRLPDGRIAVVNCDSKFLPQSVATAVVIGVRSQHRRSCRIPLVNNIQATFSGDKAKLKWPVSIDGKKLENEIYKILAVTSNSGRSFSCA